MFQKHFALLVAIGLCFPFTSIAAEKDSEKIKSLELKVDDLAKRLLEKENKDAKGTSSVTELEAATPNATKDDEKLFGMINRSSNALRIGSYGEVKVRNQDSPTGSKTGFDASRIVLLPSYRITDNIIFNSEIEFEHGGAAGFGGDDKQFEGGNIEVEQLYIDFMFNEHINWRSIGIDLVPIGYINLYHEPTNFYSTDRPEIYEHVIPSTWFEGSTSIFGKIVDGLNYQFQVSTGLEDNSNPQEEGVPAPGITGEDGIRESRPSVGDFNQSNNDFGYALRISYTPSFLPGFSGSTSGYFTRTTARQPVGMPGFVPGDSELLLIDSEFRYRILQTGFELRGEYVHIFLMNSQNLLGNNDTDAINNTGDQMFAGSGEIAYHWTFRPSMDLVPFYRFTHVDLQSGGYQGTDINAPTGQGDRQYHTFGVAFFPIPQVVLKMDYQVVLDETVLGPESNALSAALGFFF